MNWFWLITHTIISFGNDLFGTLIEKHLFQVRNAFQLVVGVFFATNEEVFNQHIVR